MLETNSRNIGQFFLPHLKNNFFYTEPADGDLLSNVSGLPENLSKTGTVNFP